MVASCVVFRVERWVMIRRAEKGGYRGKALIDTSHMNFKTDLMDEPRDCLL